LPVSRIKFNVSVLPGNTPLMRITLSAANEKGTVVSVCDGGGINSSCACEPVAKKMLAASKGVIIGKAFIAMPLTVLIKDTVILPRHGIVLQKNRGHPFLPTVRYAIGVSECQPQSVSSSPN